MKDNLLVVNEESEDKQEKKYQLLKRIEVPFSEYIQISKKRRPVPYVKDKCRLPKRYLDESLFNWNEKGYLTNLQTREVIVRNYLTAGTPRNKKVRGQDIYNGHISRQARATLVRMIHEQFSKFIKDIEPIKDIKHYPLGVYLIFKVHDLGARNQDNDNRWIWEKAIQDTLVQEGIIPDDNPYIVWENVKRTILISSEREPTISIEIHGYA